MGNERYSGYDDLVRSLGGRSTGEPSRRRKPNDDEIELFVTSEDKAREAKLREELDHRDHRPGAYRQPEESVYFRYTDKKRVRKYTDEEMARLREGARRVIVHDYGELDFYHLTDEERERNDQLASISLKLGNLKRIYRSVDKYIEAMRVVYQAWSILAENSPLHTREEFFEYVAKGIIVSNRILTPKLKGITGYNEDLLLQYVSNPTLDPKDLLPKQLSDRDDYYYADVEEQKFEMDCLLSPKEIEYVVRHDDLPDEERIVLPVKPIKRKFLKAYDDQQGLGRRKRKRGMKKIDRDLQPDMTAILKRLVKADADRDPYATMSSFNSLTDVFDASKRKTVWDQVPYAGSWQDDEEVELYELAVSEELMREPIPGGGGITAADRENQIFYRTMESMGISTVDWRRDSTQGGGTYLQEKARRSRKQNRKLERKIINRLGEMQVDPKFKKLIKRSEKSLMDYRSERSEEERYGE